MEEDCVFCRIIEGEVSANVVKETEQWIAFLDAEPVSKGHTLVVPKNHVEDIHEAGDMRFMWDAMCEIANALRDSLDPKGINITQNNGSVAGQEVFHLHFHVTPRYDGSEVDLSYNRSDLEDGDRIAETIGSKIT